MPIIITEIKRDNDIYIGESISKKIIATGLFEEDDDGNWSAKRGLVFGILTEDGEIQDNLFNITHTPTDEINENYFPTVITVPPGVGSISPGQRRGVFIRHVNETISGGLCPEDSETCHILPHAVTILRRD